MADSDRRPYQIYVFKQAHNANENLPGVLRPYQGIDTGPDQADEPSWLDVKGGSGQVLIWKNGAFKMVGKDSSEGVFYPGTDITNGDLKCAEAIAIDDELLIHYVAVGYREEPAS